MIGDDGHSRRMIHIGHSWQRRLCIDTGALRARQHAAMGGLGFPPLGLEFRDRPASFVH